MAGQQNPVEWRVMGETVPGASHLRAGIPNQDAILLVRESGRGLPLVVSISDGHGSNKCFRSDRGSRFAVRCGARLVVEFLDESRGMAQLAQLEGRAKEWMAREFVRRWREAAEADLKARPFTEAELELLEKKDGRQALRLLACNPLLAYGATSLTVAVADSFVLYFQIGDGEILNISEACEVTRALPEDERLFANETTSLCTPDAERNFRVRVRPLTDERPALILLSTDGYANSFSDSAGFFKVGSDLLEMLRSDGFDSVNASLRSWLEEATHAGSGDDCTLGLICRMDALCRAEERQGTGFVSADETEAASTVERAPKSEAGEGVLPVSPAEGVAPSAQRRADAQFETVEGGGATQSAAATPLTDPGERSA